MESTDPVSHPAAAHPVSAHPHVGPVLPFAGLRVAWLQVSGTVCNLACLHCFAVGGPKNRSHPMMTSASIMRHLEAAARAGAAAFYFTGGEPFLHPEILEVSEQALRHGQLCILTNAILVTPELAEALAVLARRSSFPLEVRVSLDGSTAAENDAIRGRGSFAKILRGARTLQDAGIDPCFAATLLDLPGRAALEGRARFVEGLAAHGFVAPRVRFNPPLPMGREARRSRVIHAAMARLEVDGTHEGGASGYVPQCAVSRVVTTNGVFPCPMLIHAVGARMGERLEDGFRALRLNHPACVSCRLEGFSCLA